MAHLPLLRAHISRAQGLWCDAATGWLAICWLSQTDGNDCRRPEKEKRLTAHRELRASDSPVARLPRAGRYPAQVRSVCTRQRILPMKNLMAATALLFLSVNVTVAQDERPFLKTRR